MSSFAISEYHFSMTSEELRKTFSENIKRYRKICAMTQMMLAEKADLSVGYLCDLEAGNKWKCRCIAARKMTKKALVSLRAKAFSFLLRSYQDQTFFVIKPLRRQRVHILIVIVVPPSSVLTSTIFGFHVRRTWLYDFETLLPVIEPFPQISHLLDISKPSCNLLVRYNIKMTQTRQ